MTPRENSLSSSAFSHAGLDSTQIRNDSNSDGLQDKLIREAALLASLPETARSGFLKRVSSSTENWETVLEVAFGAAVGVGLSLAHRNPGGLWGLAGKISAVAPQALATLAAVDVGARLKEPVVNVWNDGSSLEQNKKNLGDQIGALAFDYGAMLAAGGVAAKATSSWMRPSAFDSRSEALAGIKRTGLMSEKSQILVSAETVRSANTQPPMKRDGWYRRDVYRETVYMLNSLNKPESVVSSEADRVLWDQLRKSVVRVERLRGEHKGAGTGFVVGSDGLIATAYHVAKGLPRGENLRVRLQPGFYYDGQVVARDRLADIALVKLQGIDRPLKPLQIARPDQFSFGSDVYSFGHAGGAREMTMSRGLFNHTDTKPFSKPVSTITGKVEDVAKVVSDVPVGPGMSGGPSVLRDGRVIGVTTSMRLRQAISTSSEHLNTLLSAYASAKLPADGVLSIRGKATGGSDGKPLTVDVVRARILSTKS